jgi:hypothetical protein
MALHHGLNVKEATSRLLRVLNKRVLQPRTSTKELRQYFRDVCKKLSDSSEDGFCKVSDDELEQLALIFSRYDSDCSGVLSRAQFTSLLELLSQRSGATPLKPDQHELIFREVWLFSPFSPPRACARRVASCRLYCERHPSLRMRRRTSRAATR